MMNVIVLAVIALLAALGIRSTMRRLRGDCGCEGGGGTVRLAPEDKDRTHYRYEAAVSIEGMKCKNCALTVANALNRESGIWADAVRFKTGTAHLLLKDGVTDATIEDSIAAAGYRVQNISRSAL